MPNEAIPKKYLSDITRTLMTNPVQVTFDKETSVVADASETDAFRKCNGATISKLEKLRLEIMKYQNEQIFNKVRTGHLKQINLLDLTCEQLNYSPTEGNHAGSTTLWWLVGRPEGLAVLQANSSKMDWQTLNLNACHRQGKYAGITQGDCTKVQNLNNDEVYEKHSK